MMTPGISPAPPKGVHPDTPRHKTEAGQCVEPILTLLSKIQNPCR
jgi:hypothetical protein